MSKLRRLAPIVGSLLIVACGGSAASSPPTSPGTSGAPSGSPDASPSPSSQTTGEISHPTGATDVVLRMEEGGGFVPIEFNAANAPIFTLYGDGVVIFKPLTEFFPEPGPDGIVRSEPFRTAKLDEAQIQDLLGFALGPGGLATARASYANDMIMDASTTTFTISTGDATKKVDIYALGLTQPGEPDEVARTAFHALAERLRNFDENGSIPTDEYVPAGYRTVLIEREPGNIGPAPVAWPWPDLGIEDFAFDINAAGALQMPHRAMTAEEIELAGITDVTGGLQGLIVQGPDEKVYSVVIRPLLIDEEE